MRDCWVIPPKHDADFVACMEEVLDLYERPYDARFPVVCMDEQPVQLIGESRLPLPMLPGQVQRYDYEYRRNGAVVNFMFTEPLGSWRKVSVRETKTMIDWAREMKMLLDEDYRQQLPMLDDNILDYYHFRDHVVKTSHGLYGEGSREAVAWREEMMGVVWEHGSLVFLDRLSEHYKTLRRPAKRDALKGLQKYVVTRVEMTDYPAFRARGYDCGSGPTESFCGCLTRRLKGRGMRWDGDNAEAIMALSSIYYTNQWKRYWKAERKGA